MPEDKESIIEFASRPLAEWPRDGRRAIKYLLTDIDDTLTDGGQLGAATYGAMHNLHAAGIEIIPVTGRPAGWCDHIARMWPVAGVIGENGAFYFAYDKGRREMSRRFWRSEEERKIDNRKLDALRERILKEVPGAAVPSDQPYRVADLAIDFAEDVTPLDDVAINRIVALFEAEGAQAKVSSIHVNGWFGNYDKLAMARLFLTERFDVDFDRKNSEIVFIGDSPNDGPLFGAVNNSVGVANVCDQFDRIISPPTWITTARGGAGFVEVAEALLSARS